MVSSFEPIIQGGYILHKKSMILMAHTGDAWLICKK